MTKLTQSIRAVAQFVLSFAILMIMLLLGKWLSLIIPAIPEGIWGLFLLLACLISGVIQKAWILPAARLFNHYMAILFLPICVGVINYGEILQQRFAELVLANVISTLGSLLLIAWFAHRILKGKDQ